MAPVNDRITHLIVSAADESEAVQFVVYQLQGLAVARHARGFTVPELTQESIELIDGEWTKVFEFSAEFLPGVHDASR